MNETPTQRRLPVTAFSGIPGTGITSPRATTRRTGVAAPVADPEIEIAATISGLERISASDLDLVIWRRSLTSRLATWLERLDASSLPHLRLVVEPGNVRRTMEPLLDECGMSKDAMRALLLRDIEALVATFASIARTDSVDVRFESVSHVPAGSSSRLRGAPVADDLPRAGHRVGAALPCGPGGARPEAVRRTDRAAAKA